MAVTATEYGRQALAASWAIAQMGAQNYANLCERFIENAYGTSSQYGSAAQAGSNLAATRDMSQADVGDLVFFKPDPSNGNAGHAAIYVGNGEMVGAINGGVKRSKIMDGGYWQNLLVGFGDPPDAWKGVPSTPELVQGAASLAAGGALLNGDRSTAQSLQPAALWGGAGKWLSQITDAAQANGIPVNMLAAMVNAESGGDPNAGSPAGARGLLQLMPATAKSLGVTDPNDPVQNLNAGAKYFKQMYDQFGDWKKALQAYNAGPAGNWNNAETVNHVKKVFANMDTIGDALSGGAAGGGMPPPGGGGDRNRDQNMTGNTNPYAGSNRGVPGGGPSVQDIGGLLDWMRQHAQEIDWGAVTQAVQSTSNPAPSIPGRAVQAGFAAGQTLAGGLAGGGPGGGGAPPPGGPGGGGDRNNTGQTNTPGDAYRNFFGWIAQHLPEVDWGKIAGQGAKDIIGGMGTAGQVASGLTGQATAGLGTPSLSPSTTQPGVPAGANMPIGGGEPGTPTGLLPIDQIKNPALKAMAEQHNKNVTELNNLEFASNAIVLPPESDPSYKALSAQKASIEAKISSLKLTIQAAIPSIATGIQNETPPPRQDQIVPGTTGRDQPKIAIAHTDANGNVTISYEDNLNYSADESAKGLQDTRLQADAARAAAGDAAAMARLNAQLGSDKALEAVRQSGANQRNDAGIASAEKINQVNSTTQRATSAMAAAVQQEASRVAALIEAGKMDLAEATQRFNEWKTVHVDTPLAILTQQRETARLQLEQQANITGRASAQSTADIGRTNAGTSAYQVASNAYNQTMGQTISSQDAALAQQTMNYNPRAQIGGPGNQYGTGTFQVNESMDAFASRKAAEALAHISPYAQNILASTQQLGDPGQVNTGALNDTSNQAISQLQGAMNTGGPNANRTPSIPNLPPQVNIGAMANAGTMGGLSLNDINSQIPNYGS